ncbi:MAG: hypothetical protein IJC56_10310 [Clostridia bacterium]|nr:hypothetical protein [Clostridia bacterium]
MTGRERVHAAMHYKAVDKAPLQYYYCPVGYYEHGEKLNDLYASLPGDFQPFARMPIVGPRPEDHDADGKFHSFHTDEWGVVWEKRIFGVTGIPCKWPLEDTSKLDTYVPPKMILPGSPECEKTKSDIRRNQENGFYSFHGGGGIYEKLISLVGDENALCGIALQEPEIEQIADMIAEHSRAAVECAVYCGADGVSMGDDYGGERQLLMHPDMWRRFMKPRLKYIMEPAVKAGLDIHFHSCGYVWDILEDLKELGVCSIWPQLPAYNMEELAKRCRELELAVAIHTDRARTMTYGTPQQVRELIKREYDVFRMWEGGSWFYVEADNGFPYTNIEAQIETIAQWR